MAQRLRDPPLTAFIADMVDRLMILKPNSSFASEDYLPRLVEEIETSVPKYSTAAIIMGFRRLIRTPGKELPDAGTILLALDDAEDEFKEKTEPLKFLTWRQERAAAKLLKVAQSPPVDWDSSDDVPDDDVGLMPELTGDIDGDTGEAF